MFLSHLKEILKASARNSEKKYDITDHFDLSKINLQTDRIKIYSDNCSLKLIKTNSQDVHCNIYTTDTKALESLNISSKYVDNTLEIKITYDAELINVYVNFMLDKLKKLNIVNQNGDVCLNSIESNDLDIVSTNGDIVVENTISKDCALNSQNGNIVLKLNKEYNLCLSTKNGKLVQNSHYNNPEAKSKIFNKTKNGNIVVE